MPRAAPLALLLLLLPACAGDESETSGPQPATSAPAADQEAVDSWVRAFCEHGNRVQRDVEELGAGLAAQVDEAETPRELKVRFRRHFERVGQRIRDWRADLDELGPAPVENGPAVALAVDDGLAESEDAFRDIGDLVQGLPERSREAFLREGDRVFDGMDTRFERVEEMMNPERPELPELDRAWEAEPGCRRFERD